MLIIKTIIASRVNITLNNFLIGFLYIMPNVFVYGKLRVWGRGFSEGKSEAGKQATNFVLAKTSNFLYTVLPTVFLFFYRNIKICRNVYFFIFFIIHFKYCD